MTDIETAIMIKNMARETVRRMTVKNAEDDDIKKTRVRLLLIRRGGYPSDVDKMLLKNYEWAASRYDSVEDIALAVKTLAGK